MSALLRSLRRIVLPAQGARAGGGATFLRRGRRRACLLAAMALLLGCRRDDVACRGCSVVLVSIDTLRADHLGVYGYARPTSPHLDALAQSAVVFESAFSDSPNTIVSHATMLSALPAMAHGVTTEDPLAAEITTLAESFERLGYATAGFTSHAVWLNEKMGFAQGFGTFESVYRSAPKINERVFAWLRERAEEPFFLFVHYYDVHSDYGRLPYETVPEFDRRFTADYRGSFDGCRGDLCAGRLLYQLRLEDGSLTREDLDYIVGLYDGGIAFTDHHVGSLLAELGALGVREKTVVLVTSDHGEEFGEHGAMLHTQAYAEVARVPLLLSLPGRTRGIRVHALAGTVDVAPTLLDLVGAPPPPYAQGRSLVPLARGRELPARALLGFPRAHEPVAPAERARDVVFRDGRFGLHARDRFARLELYDLRSDPGERRDLAAAHGELARELLARTQAALAEQEALGARVAARPARITVSPEEKEMLRALGYAE